MHFEIEVWWYRGEFQYNIRGQHTIILCIHAQTGLSSQSDINFFGSYSKSGQLEGRLSTQNKVNSILVDGKKLPVDDDIKFAKLTMQ